MNTEPIKMLAIVGLELWDSHLIGNAPPSHTKRWQRMRSPQPGDLVVETSTSGLWRRGASHPKVETVIGILKKIIQEPFPHEEPWDEESEGQPEPLEECFYINLLHDGSESRWTNASFVTILPVEGWR